MEAANLLHSTNFVKLQTMTDPQPLLPSKNSPDLHQSQERPLTKVEKWGRHVHPSPPRGDAPAAS